MRSLLILLRVVKGGHDSRGTIGRSREEDFVGGGIPSLSERRGLKKRRQQARPLTCVHFVRHIRNLGRISKYTRARVYLTHTRRERHEVGQLGARTSEMLISRYRGEIPGQRVHDEELLKSDNYTKQADGGGPARIPRAGRSAGCDRAAEP